MRLSLHAPTLLLAVFLLAGCQSLDRVFGSSDGKAPLTGERISVLQLQKELVPSPALRQMPIQMPEPWANQLWPQAGGYPNHAMGHLALGSDLKLAWRESIGQGGGRRTPLTASPVVADGSVFTLDTAGVVTSFDLATGKRKWRQSIVPRGEEDSGAVGGGISYADGKLYVTCGYKYLAALDPVTGRLVWRTPTPSPGRAAPTVMGGRVFLITLDNRLMVYDVVNGAPLWKYEGVSETTNLLGSAAAAADDHLVVLPLSSGELYGLDPLSGRVLWQDNLSAVRRTGTLSSITDIRAFPVIDQGLVYAVSYSGRMVALDQATGRRLWQRELGSAETPWAAGDTIFVVTAEQQLAALARQNGDIHWVTPLPRRSERDRNEPAVWAGPVLAGGRLFLTGSDGLLMEVNPLDGKVIRTQKLNGGSMIAPVVAAGTLLILTTDGELSAYR